MIVYLEYSRMDGFLATQQLIWSFK